jgi:CDP-glucose 4,6-dehydratase
LEGVGVNKQFWQGRRVFLTGHTGFKGAWLSLWLQKLGAKVVGYALSPQTTPSLFQLARVDEGMQSIIGDIRDPEHLSRALQDSQAEIVLHLAAQALVRPAYRNPVETYSTNVMGLVHLFEAVRQAGHVRAVVNVTSDKCYENKEWPWGYREDEPMGGYDPYSNSKGCAELVTSAYRNSFFSPQGARPVALGSARAGNVIGGGDWALDRLVPDIVRALGQGMPVSIRSPHAIRPWQHVLEPLSGYLLLAERLLEEGHSYAEGWNFGPQDADARPVQWVVERLTQQWGEGASWVLDSSRQPHEATYLKLDCSKARQRLQWQARWSLEHTLQRIVEWHQAVAAGADAQQICLAQISAFEESPTQS